MSNYPRHRGFTLIELVIVVAVLVILAGLLLPGLERTQDDSAAAVTKASMLMIREVILGAPGQAGYRSDTGKLPAHICDLFIRPGDVKPFDPNTGRGWRGPYIRDAGTGFQKGYHIYKKGDPVALQGFTDEYGNDDDRVPLDGWGRPIVIQIQNLKDPQNARLVSAGPGGILETPSSKEYPTPCKPDPRTGDPNCATGERGDDVVLFLLRVDAP